ncbi:unnamed protein product [Prorocentrum cordatum]|uniref:EF-hand domain-containing protein n=1 Tax=Prorocentrum cordatum TaxID=2364126 RepID=A0ABN9URL0_9DINO|nr:unnamed protein product [Polarella glacialis]
MQLFRKFLDRRYESLRQAFRALSAAGGAGRDARFDRTDLAAVLRANCAGVSEDQVDEIFRRFDSSGSGDVSYPEFCAVMSQSAVFGGHLDRQTFRDPPPRAGAAGPAGGWAPAARADFRPPRGFQPPPRSAAVGFQPPPRSAAPF